MKKWLLVAMLLLIKSTLFGEVKHFVGGNLGIFSGNRELRTSVIGGAQIGLNSEHLGTSLGIYHYNKANKTRTLSQGSFSLTPFMFDIFGRLPLKNSENTEVAALRAGAGFNYTVVNNEPNDSIKNAFKANSQTYEEKVFSDFGLQANVGFDYWLTDRLSIGADIIYMLFRCEVETTISDDTGVVKPQLIEENIRLDTVIAFTTLKYFF